MSIEMTEELRIGSELVSRPVDGTDIPEGNVRDKIDLLRSGNVLKMNPPFAMRVGWGCVVNPDKDLNPGVVDALKFKSPTGILPGFAQIELGVLVQCTNIDDDDAR